MRTLALTAIAIVLARSVLDPTAGISMVDGLILMGIAVAAVNCLFPRRGIGIGSLLAIHLITRRNRRKEVRYASPAATPLRPRGSTARRPQHESGRKAA